MSADDEVESVATLLADDTVRCLLLATREGPLSAAEIADRCGVSETTVYRRIEDLAARDLVVEHTELDDGGHHSTYEATLDRVTVDVTDDGFEVAVERRDSMADAFTRLIEDL
ncbi:winged helix-turn-helix domain-containing protein [Halosimplex pelagicum]|uniref:Winged helix-turn-helix transcriptional regulator n=1 Tax=Halosimplex pelagicum TaxID=869886 RepID=A0A7D5P8F5_9EURY|nr:winged helix-turn-helix domain-containing protein [Halosimplex pelagicum]QLH80365.1 winged helix-turn-helix transcriptional regulator [Halosimplex pelagicum]